ncbi:MAG: NAD(P)/FAD-dependent oxidoreductase [Pseudotabrizicola sp.]|uniref:NAD(P)/FAD-dependent oxidoreductase n=1 Tax=Pseudotabrizicola sp. TaxID=2939647 RepID=UPI0027213DEB|nr:NAD(P)/FAD-dependent oxidoreductase [Pseudotabrizicola sp.]MDO9636989.1 NAD(P)/FAD-dependent oxidoreductase [Pseudotabrizicola sp.]
MPLPLAKPKVPRFDVAIIGAGVVGCAVARRFAREGAKVVVIEKGADILSGASKANSAILHTGFDAPPGSLELDLIKAGRAEYLDIHGALGLSIVETGALVCAWADHEGAQLESIAVQAHENGISEVHLLTGPQARQAVPGLSKALLAAVDIKGEHVIDPWSAPLAYLTEAVALGTEFRRNTELLSGSFSGDWHLQTSQGDIHAASVVNAAGLFGDEINARLGLPVDFNIRPRKGQFVVLDKAAAVHVPKILLPVPNEITKGIVICPTAFGNVLVGPTAEEQGDRDRATVETATLEMLKAHGERLVPSLAGIEVTAVYAGLRPGTEKKHYRVSSDPKSRAIVLGGIRSTGLSAALGLAQHAVRLHAAFAQPFLKPAEIPPVTVPNLTETRPRDWQQPGHGEILCHCEMVTRREVETCLTSPVPPGDFGGLRRRTRAGMGRCQGFYCQGRLAEISAGHLACPLSCEGAAE